MNTDNIKQKADAKKIELLDELIWRFKEYKKNPRAERPMDAEDWVEELKYLIKEVEKVV